MIKPLTYALTSERNRIADTMLDELRMYHEDYPLRLGMNRAEWQRDASFPKELREAAGAYLIETGMVTADNHIVRMTEFKPHYPSKWEKRLQSVKRELHSQGLKPEPWTELVSNAQLPETLVNDFKRFLIDIGLAYSMGEDLLISGEKVNEALIALKDKTGNAFTVQEAKEILGLTRKHLIPFLELLDNKGWTKREDHLRRWVDKER